MRYLISILIFALPAFSQCTGYSFSHAIDINRSKVPSTQSGFTLLFSGIYNGTGGAPDLRVTGSGGGMQNANASDLCFSDTANSFKYSWDLKNYVGSSGAIAVYVGPIATLNGAADSTNTSIHMWWGKAGVSTFQGGAVGTAWDSHTKFLQHLGNGVSLNLNDASVSGINCTNNGATPVAGQVDGAALIGGTNHIDCGNPAALRMAGDYTISLWEKLTDLTVTAEQYFFANAAISTNLYGILLSLGNYGSNFQIRLLHEDGTGSYLPKITTTALADTNWHAVTATYSAGTTAANVYVDGLASGAPALTVPHPAYVAGNLVRIGSINVGSEINNFNGALGEVRVDDIARSPDWIASRYNNESSPSTFYSVGSAPTPPVIGSPSCTANSPSSAKCTWTTDIASSSQIGCGLVTGGPYNIYQTTSVYSGPNNGVTAHSMVIPGLPTNVSPTAYFCKVSSVSSATGGIAFSTEVTTGTLAAMVSTPLAIQISPLTRYNDQYNGVRGLPNTGIAANGDTYFPTMWADDGKLYGPGNDTYWLATGHGAYTGWGTGSNVAIYGTNPTGNTPAAVTASLMTMTLVNKLSNFGPFDTVNTCTNGTQSGTGCWADGATWKSGNGISFNHKLVQPITRQSFTLANLWGDASLMVSSDHGATWLNSTNYPAGTPQPNGDAPAVGTGMWMGYGAANNCGNATIPQHGQDYGFTNPANFVNYANTDAFVYLLCYRGDVAFGYVARVRVEDFLLLDVTKYQYYTGGDGLLDVNWTSNIGLAAATGVLSTGAGNGMCIQGVEFIPDFNRWLFTCAPGPAGANSAVVVILDAPYPWGPTFTQVASMPRAQAYLNYTPVFTFPLASTYSRISSNPLVSSIVVMTSGGSNGQNPSDPATDEYSPHWFTARLVPSDRVPLRSMVGNGRNRHIAAGLDLFYHFQGGAGPSGPSYATSQGSAESFTVPDFSPNKKYSIGLPISTPGIFDQYGMINFGFWSGSSSSCSPACAQPVNYTLATPYNPALNDFTMAVVFSHYPASMPVSSGELVLDKTDLRLLRNGSAPNSWGIATTGQVAVTNAACAGNIVTLTTNTNAFTGGPVAISGMNPSAYNAIVTPTQVTSSSVSYNAGSCPGAFAGGGTVANAIGPFTLTTDGGFAALLIRRIGSAVTVYQSSGVGTSLPLTPLAVGTVSGPLGANSLNIGPTLHGIMSELLIYNRGLTDDELLHEMAVIRRDMGQRGISLP